MNRHAVSTLDPSRAVHHISTRVRVHRASSDAFARERPRRTVRSRARPVAPRANATRGDIDRRVGGTCRRLIHFRFDSFAFERRWGRRPMVTRRRLCARRRTRARWSVDGSTSDGGSRDGGWRVGRARASARRRRGDDDGREDDDGRCSRKNRVRRKNWIRIRNRWARGRREGRRCREWEGGRRRWSRLRRRVRRFERL